MRVGPFWGPVSGVRSVGHRSLVRSVGQRPKVGPERLVANFTGSTARDPGTASDSTAPGPWLGSLGPETMGPLDKTAPALPTGRGLGLWPQGYSQGPSLAWGLTVRPQEAKKCPWGPSWHRLQTG